MALYAFDTKPFADLIEERAISQVTIAFEQIILNSFGTEAARIYKETGKVRNPKITMSEIKRRFNILAEWFKVFRGYLGWSINRTLDELPKVLREILDGKIYVPSKRAMWSPTMEV